MGMFMKDPFDATQFKDYNHVQRDAKCSLATQQLCFWWNFLEIWMPIYVLKSSVQWNL